MIKKVPGCFFAVILWVALACAAHAGDHLMQASLFTDHMVLQRNTNVTVWGQADVGSTVVVTGSWESPSVPAQTVVDSQGRWSVKLPTPAAGGPYSVSIKSADEAVVLNDVLIGEVWICSGQSNMEFGLGAARNGAQEIAAAKYPGIRLFVVPRKTARTPEEAVDSAWHPCTPEAVASIGSASYKKGSGKSFSAVGYFFGRELHQELNVPVGLIQTAYGGTPAEAWTQPEWLAQNGLSSINDSWRKWDAETEQYNESMKQWQIASADAEKNNGRIPPKPLKPGLRAEQYRPGSLYNAMLAPLIPFSIRGVIWYQGESNTGVFRDYRKKYAALYSDLFATTIADWRHLWGNEELPFYFVQIAPWNYKNPAGCVAAKLRESQLEVFKKTPYTGMVVTTDIGDVDNIHPLDKQDVGDRLARWALAKIYGRNVEYSGPIYAGFEKKDSAIRVQFDHGDGGLVFKDGPATCWEIAGKNQVFYPAKALVEGDSVIVSSEHVNDPAAIRFGFTNASQPNFFNEAGLPASPFRTDRWPVTP